MKHLKKVAAVLILGSTSTVFADSLAIDDEVDFTVTADVQDVIAMTFDRAPTIEFNHDHVNDRWLQPLGITVTRRGATPDNPLGFSLEVKGTSGGEGVNYFLNTNSSGGGIGTFEHHQMSMNLLYRNRPEGNWDDFNPLGRDESKMFHFGGIESNLQTKSGLAAGRSARSDTVNVGVGLVISSDEIKNAVPGEYTTTLTFIASAI